MSIGSVRNSTQPPLESVFELKARPVRSGDRCLLHQLEGQRRIWLPTICPNREMSPESTRRATLVLVAPTWSAQAWYPALLELLISDPVLLPKRRDLLTDPFNRFHAMENLQLVTWKVSGDSTMTWEYQRGLPSSSWLDGVKAQIRLISQPGKDGVAGVLNGKLIRFHVESNPS